MSVRIAGVGKLHTELRGTILGRVTRESIDPRYRSDYVWIAPETWLPRTGANHSEGYAGLLCRQSLDTDQLAICKTPTIAAFDASHLNEGDIVALNRTGYVRTLYRVGSRHNSVLATEHCNSYCLMCSQPPRQTNESDRLAQHLRLLDLIPDIPTELGITGGEPTLLKDDLLTLIRGCKERFPATPLHLLSNGRLFYYGSFARRLAEIGHPDLMIGVPLYSDVDSEHDFIVQARGAFHQTVLGLQNLGRYRVPVEIRIVIHRLTCERLLDIGEFIYRNLTFAAHVAFMGLELTGFTLPNIEQLWVDPWEYRLGLERAVQFLADRGMNPSVYNHQLCTLPSTLWPWCRQSISDWKREYLPTCMDCRARETCGGFFFSVASTRMSAHIAPIKQEVHS